MIKVKGLNKSYGKNKVLCGIDLNAANGEIVGIFGANGSGKSTFLKCVAGLTSCSGEISLDGRSLSENHSLMKDVGVMIETPAFYKDMTGRENIKFFCPDYSSAQQYIDVLAANDFIDRKVRTYSVGMKQKLGLLIACIKGKELVLLDEPFNGLDVISLDQADKLIDICKKKGACILLTSHMLEHSSGLCDRYYLLKDGKVVPNEELLKFEKPRYSVEMRSLQAKEKISALYADIITDKPGKTFEVVLEDADIEKRFFFALSEYGFSSVKDITDTLESKYRIMEHGYEAR